VLSFRRGNDFVCMVNFTGSPVAVDPLGEPVLSSAPVKGEHPATRFGGVVADLEHSG